jgi:hypothetical protein
MHSNTLTTPEPATAPLTPEQDSMRASLLEMQAFLEKGYPGAAADSLREAVWTSAPCLPHEWPLFLRTFRHKEKSEVSPRIFDQLLADALCCRPFLDALAAQALASSDGSLWTSHPSAANRLRLAALAPFESHPGFPAAMLPLACDAARSSDHDVELARELAQSCRPGLFGADAKREILSFWISIGGLDEARLAETRKNRSLALSFLENAGLVDPADYLDAIGECSDFQLACGMRAQAGSVLAERLGADAARPSEWKALAAKARHRATENHADSAMVELADRLAALAEAGALAQELLRAASKSSKEAREPGAEPSADGASPALSRKPRAL